VIRTIALTTTLLLGTIAVAQTPDPATCPLHAEHMKAEGKQTTDSDHKQHVEGMAQPMAAEKSPYTDRTALPIKALTQDAMDGYHNGTGMGLAIPAEMNGYPGPRHILDMADKLELTAEQRAKLQPIYDRMHKEAVRIGGEVIDLERALDADFARATMTEAELSSLTREISERQGRLRFVHLQAHLAAKGLLTPAQIEAYTALRGYSSDAQHAHAH
jgi:Spy/CpxP family protein refolding chaperone